MMEHDASRIEIDQGLGGGLRALSKAFHHAFRLLAVAIVGLILWYFTFGGAFVVEQHERALISTFGAVSPEVLGPGWHWTWPEPICSIIRVPATRQSLSTEAFWFYEQPGAKIDENAYRSMRLDPGKDGYLITGDANIVHSAWKLFYKITDPLRFHMACFADSDNDLTAPTTLLKHTFETSILRICASNNVDFTLKSPLFRKAVQDEVARRVADLDIGVMVEDVVLAGRTPPLGAVRSFQAVIEAELNSSTEKHRAETYAIKTLNEAESACAAVIADSNAYKTRTVESVKSDARKFENILEKYRSNPNVVPVALYFNALSKVMASAKDIFVLRRSSGDQEVRLLLNRDPAKAEVEDTESNKQNGN